MQISLGPSSASCQSLLTIGRIPESIVLDLVVSRYYVSKLVS